MNNLQPYGTGDTSYQAAGGEEGIQQLVRDFYTIMDSDPAAKTIRHMHPKDIDSSYEKLWRFLSGWMNGPKRYREKYGTDIAIPWVHQPFPIGQEEADAWLSCMRQALDKQPYAEDFKIYLMQELLFPVQRILEVQQQTKTQ